MKFRRITWDDLEKACIDLAKKIRGNKFDEIIAISRGGLVQGRILSDILDLPMSNIAMTFYKDFKKLDRPLITQTLPPGYFRKNILLVDGVSDTGKTFNEAIKYLKTLQIQKVSSTSVFIKPETSFIPDYWYEQINVWIIFPYEVKETKKTFLKLYAENEALNKLREIGLRDWEIEDI